MSDDAAAAVRVRGGIVQASVQAERSPDEDWASFLGRVLVEVRGGSRRKPPTTFCVSDYRCRSVPLFGEPVDASPTSVAARFQERPHDYAIGGTEGLVGGSVQRREGEWEGLVLCRSIALAVGVACTEQRAELVAVVNASRPQDRQGLVTVAINAAAPAHGGTMSVDLWRVKREQCARRRRRVALGLVAAVGAMWALLVPALVAQSVAQSAEAAAVVAEEAVAAAGLSRTDEALRALAGDINRDRGRATRLISAAARALPDSSAIVAFRLDDEGGSLTLLARHAADVVTRLTRDPELRVAQIDGSIVEEEHDGLALQRITISWHVPRSSDR